MSSLRPGYWIKVWIPGNIKHGILSVWHHGIVSSVNKKTIKVIHFSLPEGSTDEERRVTETSLDWFLQGGEDPQIVDEEPNYTYTQVVDRARSKIGATEYHLPSRNCEHFAHWCFLGSAFSQQVHQYGVGFGVAAVLCTVISFVLVNMARNPWT